MTSISALSKPDTVLLWFGADDTFVDASQYRQNLNDHSSYFDEAASARTAIAAPREITFQIYVSNTDTGVLVNHGTGYRVQVFAGGIVRFYEGGAVLTSITVPGVNALQRQTLVQWSKRLDPVTGLARSEMMIYNYATGAYAHAAVTHASVAPSALATITIWAAGGGASTFTGNITAYRIGRRFHAKTEVKEDWVSQRMPPGVYNRRRAPYLSPDRATLAVFGHGNLAGPQYLWTGSAYKAASARLVSPLVNMRTATPAELTNGYAVGSVAWYRSPPGEPKYHLTIAHLFCVPVPHGVNRARVRIFLRQTAGATTCTTYWKMYSVANLATRDDPPAPDVWSSTAPATNATNHGTGVGAWLNLGDLALRRDDLGYTWLALGHSFGLDTGAPGEAATTCRIKAITVEPFYLDPSPGFDMEAAP